MPSSADQQVPLYQRFTLAATFSELTSDARYGSQGYTLGMSFGPFRLSPAQADVPTATGSPARKPRGSATPDDRHRRTAMPPLAGPRVTSRSRAAHLIATLTTSPFDRSTATSSYRPRPACSSATSTASGRDSRGLGDVNEQPLATTLTISTTRRPGSSLRERCGQRLPVAPTAFAGSMRRTPPGLVSTAT